MFGDAKTNTGVTMNLNWLKKLTKKIRNRNINREIEWAYIPAYYMHVDLLKYRSTVDKHINLMRWLQTEILKEDEEKESTDQMKDRWKVVKIEPIIECYELILNKIDDLIAHTPEPA